MGKIKVDSDDEAMDIEEPVKYQKKIAKKTHKQKAIAGPSRVKIVRKKQDLLKKVSKNVNLKKKAKSLHAKQDIFHKIVEGLKDRTGVTKKNKKKQRTLLKKELRKKLEEQHIRKRSSDNLQQDSMDEQEIQKPNPPKAKKKQFDEREKVAQFQSLMGAGLQNIRSIVARNIGAQ